MKKTVAAAVAAVVAGAAAAIIASSSGLNPELCYARKIPSAPETCECQGNEQLKNRSPRNVANYPAWGDCGAVPRPGKFMRGNCELVTGPCR